MSNIVHVYAIVKKLDLQVTFPASFKVSMYIATRLHAFVLGIGDIDILAYDYYEAKIS